MPYPWAKPPAGGIKANYPGFIEPSLATSIDKVPAGERWIHEIKFDGYRVQVHLRDAAVKVFTRRGNDWTNRFRKIAADAWNINAGSAIIDGEVIRLSGFLARNGQPHHLLDPATDKDAADLSVAPVVGPDDPRRFTDSGIEIEPLYTEDDLPAVYNGARALLFPSYYEGFGLPALEAIAFNGRTAAAVSAGRPVSELDSVCSA